MEEVVFFICIHNSARSQMAEAFLNQISGDAFEAHSAGSLSRLIGGALPNAATTVDEWREAG